MVFIIGLVVAFKMLYLNDKCVIELLHQAFAHLRQKQKAILASQFQNLPLVEDCGQQIAAVSGLVPCNLPIFEFGHTCPVSNAFRSGNESW